MCDTRRCVSYRQPPLKGGFAGMYSQMEFWNKREIMSLVSMKTDNPAAHQSGYQY